MSADARPLGARFAWCLRTYAWLLVACVLAMAAAPLFVPPSPPTYQASALVVARALGVDREVLPRLGQALFSSGYVESAVAADPALGADGEPLVPERLSVVAAEDSVVFAVQARDPDPTIAARLADLAANAFVEELNRGGAGVGEFGMQAQATVPTQPLPTLSTTTRVALGAGAGAVLGFALVALLAVTRRPVVTARDVEETVGVPLLGTLRLPLAKRGVHPAPLSVRGMAAVARSVATLPPGRLLLISPRSATLIRRSVYVLLAAALSLLRPVRLEAPEDLIEDSRQHRLQHGRGTGQHFPGSIDEIVLVYGGADLQVVDPARTRLSVIAVAPRGVPRRRLRALAADHVRGGLVGVVLVDVRPGLRPPTPRGSEATVPARQSVLSGVAAAETS